MTKAEYRKSLDRHFQIMREVEKAVGALMDNVTIREEHWEAEGNKEEAERVRLEAGWDLYLQSLEFCSSTEITLMGASPHEVPWLDDELVMRAVAKGGCP